MTKTTQNCTVKTTVNTKKRFLNYQDGYVSGDQTSVNIG